MEKHEIDRITQRLTKEFWGDIDPSWFVFLDLTSDLSDADPDHVAFQRVLQDEEASK